LPTATSWQNSSRSHASSTGDPLLLLLLAAALAGCCALLQPFIAALTGVCVIALLTQSPLRALRSHVPNATLAATIAVVCVTLCIIAPAALAIHFLAQRVLNALSLLDNAKAAARLHNEFAVVQSWLTRHSIPIGDFDFSSTLNRAGGPVASTVVSLVGSSVVTITQLVLMLFLLFFWYRNGDAFVSRARQLMPMTSGERRFLGGLIQRTVRAVVMGRLAVAFIQALLAWIVFLILRVPGASLLGTVTFVCCILPAVGAFFVWVPVVVYLILIQAWTRAIILGLIGTFVLSTLDNVLQAIIAGNRARMGTVEMLLSILGGVSLLGIPGLVLGPLIWVTAGGLLMVWRKRSGLPRAKAAA
jgi:predicted PurR-regulated permease PerM